MTNEEKIKEISESYSSDVLRAGAKFGAEEMAKWFKEYLEKKREELKMQIKYSTGGSFPYVMYMTMIDKIINELFKED